MTTESEPIKTTELTTEAYSVSIKAELVKLAIRQGPWAVIVFAILIWAASSIPTFLQSINDGYERVEARSREAYRDLAVEIKSLATETRDSNNLKREAIATYQQATHSLEAAVTEMRAQRAENAKHQ